jgi:hypothetical protein
VGYRKCGFRWSRALAHILIISEALFSFLFCAQDWKIYGNEWNKKELSVEIQSIFQICFFYNKTGIFNVVYKQVKKSFEDRYTSYIICANICSLKTSLMKTKSVTFYESHPVRGKRITHRHILEQVSYVQYLTCEISCAYDKDVENKLHCFQAVKQYKGQ